MTNTAPAAFSRSQMIAFLAAWMRQSPSMTIAAAKEEGKRHGFEVGTAEFYEAQRLATGTVEAAPEAPTKLIERRPRKPRATTAVDDVFDQVRRVVDERERYYKALKAIEATLARMGREPRR